MKLANWPSYAAISRLLRSASGVWLTLHTELRGGSSDEADAARRLPRSTPEEAKRDLQPP